MIFEKLPFSYDIDKLRRHLVEFVLPLPKVTQSSSFGGWSVTSSNGRYQDGWFQGQKVIAKYQGADPLEIIAELKKMSIPLPKEHNKPTEICHGYLSEVLMDIQSKDFRPTRARIICLEPQSDSTWHQDMPSQYYGVRLHIPIETNSGCFFECEEGMAHLPADGSAYLLRINRMHRVINRGLTHRYHLVMDAYDLKSLSQFHQMSQTDKDFLVKHDL